jgi:anti-sigma factor RsiW
MTCREFVDFLMGYIDGDLEAAPRRVFEEHMEMCPPCVVFMDTYRETIRLGKFACLEPEGPPPEAAPEALIQAILIARRS